MGCTVIKYYDHCKWDDGLSYTDDELDENGELAKCPVCGWELHEIVSMEEI